MEWLPADVQDLDHGFMALICGVVAVASLGLYAILG